MSDKSLSASKHHDNRKHQPKHTTNNGRIRSKFLNRLGIDDRQSAPIQRSPSRGSLLGNVRIKQETLKFDKEEHSGSSRFWFPHFLGQPSAEDSETVLSSSVSITSSSESSISSKGSRISFNTEVKVVPIPMRDEYSERVKRRLWTKPEELHRNAQRNAFEFAAEGWNWRDAFEDENMYMDSISGERIHPAHCVEFNSGQAFL
mmetsp:Transcript_27563/g.40707  ORF Transcript_27563/g.40707 Transcript_27563/m.40707 type:complete len:203 (+) Transcript_27563:44-652(+)